MDRYTVLINKGGVFWVDEDALTIEILWLCYQLDMNIHPFQSAEEILILIKVLVGKRDNFRKIVHEETTRSDNKTST